MRKSAMLAVMIILWVQIEGPSAQPTSSEPRVKVASVDLCSALKAIREGDRLRISVTGIYNRHGHLFDPFDATCGKEVQPVTLVQLAAGAEEPKELVDLLESDGQAFVTVSGTLWGEIRADPDDLEAPTEFAYVNRINGIRRYGVNSHFRTKLVAEEISNVWPADHTGVPRWFVTDRSPLPVVKSAGLIAAYPWKAWYLRVSGDVVVEVDLKMGNAVSTKVISAADRLLIKDTLENIQTWTFDPAAEGTFTTTFSYRLEDDLPSTTASIRVFTELPVRVEIVAPRRNW